MASLIKELKYEHKQLWESLDEIKALGIFSEECGGKLFALKASLLLHLQKEDEKLYPFLGKASKDDKQLKSILVAFGRKVGLFMISQEVSDFFNKYFAGMRNGAMEEDFEIIYYALRRRIKQEEEVIFTVAQTRGIVLPPASPPEDLTRGQNPGIAT